MRSLPVPDLRRTHVDEVRAYCENGFALERWLYSALAELAFTRVADPLRRPLIFYLGHTAAFFGNKLAQAGLLAEPVDAELDALFAMGVDEMPWDEMDNSRFDWPSVDRVRAYHERVRKQVFACVERVEVPVNESSHWWGLFMAMDHQRIHLETSSVLIRQLPAELVRRPDGWTYAPAGGEPPAPAEVTIPASTVRLGKPRSHPTFGWDIEYGERVAEVPAFRAGRTLVTNREFRAFVDQRGYEREELWSAAGWRWRTRVGATHPRFWVRGEGGFRLRAPFDDIDMPWSWPVEVNWHEAQAFCRFRGGRMLTEAEHLRLRHAGAPANVELAFGSPTPVDHLPPHRSGVHDAMGNVWCWVEDVVQPLPGFRPHRYYPDYARTSFDGEHQLILGGSFASTGSMASPFARSWFRPHIVQHAGFRVVTAGSL